MAWGKKKSKVIVDSFEVACLFANHVERGFVPESNEHLLLCAVCQSPLLPRVLLDTLISGADPGTELLASEALWVLIAAIGIYWAQYNLEVERFNVTGIANEEIFRSPVVVEADVVDRQSQLMNTLDSLAGYGHPSFGSLEEYRWWFGLARDMVTWQVTSEELSGEEEMSLSIQQKFAVISSKNLKAFNLLVDRALEQMDSDGHLINFFREGLETSGINERLYVPFEVTVTLDTSCYGFCDSEDVARFTAVSAEPLLGALLRETLPTWSDKWRPIACTALSTTSTVEEVEDYAWGAEGKPETGFEVKGQLTALKHDIELRFSAVVPVKRSQGDDLVVLEESFDNFELYLIHREDRICFTSEPWISTPSEDFRPNHLDDFSGFEETDEMDVVTSYTFPVFVVEFEQANAEVDWFRGSPWAISST